MTGTAGGVNHLVVSKVIKMKNSFVRSLIPDKIFHLTAKLRIRIVVKVDSSYGILDHVFYNPVRCKDLRCCRNIFGFCLLSLLETVKYLVLFLGNVELIQPADEFGLGIVFIGDVGRVIQKVNESSLCKNVVRKKD